MKGFMLALLFIPCASQAAVYKCSTESDTYFSQIPCEENAEVVAIEDTTMFTDEAHGAISTPAETELAAPPKRSPEDNMRDFVETLQRQRMEQLEDMDDQIIALEELIESGDGEDNDESRLAQLNQRLNQLNADRNSVVEQYAALIEEAEKRLEDEALQ